MTLPFVVDAQTSLSPAELQVLHDQYETEASSGHITTQTKFNYAWALIKSTHRQQMLQGVALLTDIYRTDPPRRRECLYYLALGHYKLSNFDEAKRFNGMQLFDLQQPSCWNASQKTCRRRVSTRSSSKVLPKVRHPEISDSLQKGILVWPSWAAQPPWQALH